MKRSIKYFGIFLLVIIITLVITNPSRSSFMDYVGGSGYKGLKRESNFFLFSIYKQIDYTEGYSRYTRSHYYVDGDESEYLGIAGNFFHILPNKETVPSQSEQPAIDTVKTNSITLPPPPLPKGIILKSNRNKNLPSIKEDNEELARRRAAEK